MLFLSDQWKHTLSLRQPHCNLNVPLLCLKKSLKVRPSLFNWLILIKLIHILIKEDFNYRQQTISVTHADQSLHLRRKCVCDCLYLYMGVTVTQSGRERPIYQTNKSHVSPRANVDQYGCLATKYLIWYLYQRDWQERNPITHTHTVSSVDSRMCVLIFDRRLFILDNCMCVC